jgi:ribosome maturation factor RimP
MAKNLKVRLTGLLDHEAKERGFELVLLEVGGPSRDPLVSVYLDHEGGITIDQITEANRWIKELLDSLPEMSNGYTLEVSSPGIERPLVKLSDFERFIGSDARITVGTEIDGKKHFTGTIKDVEDGTIQLDVEDGALVSIPHGRIKKARLHVQYDFSKEGTPEDGL